MARYFRCNPGSRNLALNQAPLVLLNTSDVPRFHGTFGFVLLDLVVQQELGSLRDHMYHEAIYVHCHGLVVLELLRDRGSDQKMQAISSPEVGRAASGLHSELATI